MSRKTTGAALLASAALALTLSGCVADAEDRKAESAPETDCPWTPDESITTTARIAWQAIPNGDAVVKDLGLLEACMPKAKITWVQAASGGDVITYYGADEVDLGLMGSAPAARSASEPVVRDVDIATIWIHDVIGDAESLIVKDAGVTDLAQLKGATIATPFSSTAHYSLLQALAEAGLDPAEDVTVINLDPEKMPAAWQGGEIDAAWVWDPVQSQLLEEGGARLISSSDTAAAGRPTFDVGTVDRTFAAENEDFLTQWAKAQDHAVQLIQDDPATAAESVAVVLGIDPGAAKAQFAGLEFHRASEQAGADYLGGKFAEDLLTTANFLLEQGEVDAVGDAAVYAEHVDAGPASRAAE
ncbi:MAG TPA: ABC transporter substrate-binding protein [Nocardioides sp.]|uniref:taurine ABC transporter substrate-binding protein n=1 Tax=Nocardioides sp. TaxID=35761 RepID=UPI002BC851B7|nr:ABC transporter substrate-binding protein [Nocardioides sp.]HTW18153.1 ABC transporter substrate-binding protein [Nocardioides sp.]